MTDNNKPIDATLKEGEALSLYCVQLLTEIHRLKKLIKNGGPTFDTSVWSTLQLSLNKAEARLTAAIEKLDTRLLNLHKTD